MGSSYRFLQGRIPACFVWLCAFSQLVALQVGGAEALAASGPVVPVEKYTVDLDQPPSERWIPLLKDFKSSAPLIVDYFSEQVRFISEAKKEQCMQNPIFFDIAYSIIIIIVLYAVNMFHNLPHFYLCVVSKGCW